jgi:hypothetical protein
VGGAVCTVHLAFGAREITPRIHRDNEKREADAASGTTYGDPAAAAKWWQHQKYDDCVLMASAHVIGQVMGREPSEQAIIKKAQSTPSVVHPRTIYTKPVHTKNPNSGMGTSFADIPTLLAQYKVDRAAKRAPATR